MTRPRFRWRTLYRDGWTSGQWSYGLGYDVTCGACGWESGTGGAILESVRRDIDRHLLHEHGLITVRGKVLGTLTEAS